MRKSSIAMYAGAVLTVVAVAVLALGQDGLTSRLRAAYPGNAADMASESIATYLYAVYGIGICLWLWLARASRKDRPWARIAATVAFLVGGVLLAYNFTQPHPLLVTVSGALPVVCGAAAVALLWMRAPSRAGSRTPTG